MRIGVMGAGAVGSFVGAKLVLGGSPVQFVGRARGLAEAQAHGMHLVDLEGPRVTLAPLRIDYATEATALAACDVVLCAVKSGHTAEAAQAMAGVLPAGALVVSLQNGVRNADTLRKGMPMQRVLGGIVTFNVVAAENGVFRRGTTGPLILETSEDPRLVALAERLTAAGFDLELSKDIRGQQWSKLVINLTNAVGALCGVPTRAILFEAEYRKIFRAAVVEAVSVLRAAKIPLAKIGPLPVTALPRLLALPTAIFRVVARGQLRIDPEARPSMWQDLERRRLTEVEELNGEIVKLAAASGVAAPVNKRFVELVHEAERAGNGPPNLSAGALWARLSPRSG
jgi:2-dehydropantoate 2-reductase